MKPKPILGQKLYSLNIGNAARRSGQTLTPVTVSKVGRKYFSVKENPESWCETEYRLDDWRENTEYCQNSHLYETEQQYLDEKEARIIAEKIRKIFGGWTSPDLSLETLRTIDQLITNENCK